VLFTALVDDAGLFPPEELAMPDALARYRRDTAAGQTMLTGRFLCPANALTALVASLDEEHAPAPVAIGLIAPLTADAVAAATARIAADPRLDLASIEGVASGPIAEAVAAIRDISVPRYVELPAPPPPATLDELARAGVGAKVRCGGLRAELFPTPDDLATFIVECVRRGVPVKATAGLHHAVRYVDQATGFTHHGFLNLLLAACRAVAGMDHTDVVEVLRADDADSLARETSGVSLETARRARAALVCYGSCSTSEPIDDLRALGLLLRAAPEVVR
jgi:hypothetical protein